jgi:hypothetical protein
MGSYVFCALPYFSEVSDDSAPIGLTAQNRSIK